MSADREADPPRRRVRVAYLAGDLGAGGAERQVVLLAASLDRERFEPTIVVWRDRRFYGREAEAARIPILRVPKGGRFDCTFPFRLRSALLSGGFDVWHGWLEAGSFWARTLSRGLGARRPAVIASFRCTEMRSAYRRLEPFLQRFTDATVVNGEAVREELVSRCGADAARVSLSENAIDLDRFFRGERPDRAAAAAAREETGLAALAEGMPRDLPLVALVGRIAAQKDPLTFVRSAAAAAAAGRPFAALLVGDRADGRLAAAALSLARDLGVADRVRLVPPVAAVERLYDAVDAVAFPTLYEGFPNVLVETIAAGLPVAASEIPQCRAALAGYSRARFAPTGEPKALAAAVESALRSEPAPAAARRALLARFSPGRMARDAETLYERWVAARRGSVPLGLSSEAKYASRLSMAQRARP